jgi:hypothetical protein
MLAVYANGHDLSVLFVIVALACFIGAAVAAYRTRDFVVPLVLVVIGVLALIFGA